MAKTTWAQVIAQRLQRGYLHERAAPEQLVDVVRNVCGVQAQVLAAAELGLGARVDGLRREVIQAALWERRELVKIYSLRGTLHLHPAADAQRWIAAQQRYAAWQGEQWTETYQLTAAQVDAVLAALREALDGTLLTREALALAVAERAGPWARERLASTWADLIGLGFAAGVLCFGPNDGSKVQFARLDQWIDAAPAADPDDALRWVIQRFTAAYGPTTPRAFVRWFGARQPKPETLKQLEAVFEAELAAVSIEGERAWGRADDIARDWELPRSQVRLLPQYDAYLLGGRFGREQILSAAARERVFSYKNGRFEGAVGLPILLIGGRVAGIWERKQRRKTIALRVEPFEPLTGAQRAALDAEAERIGAFYGAAPELKLEKLG